MTFVHECWLPPSCICRPDGALKGRLSLVATLEVAAHELILAVERMTRTLDAVDDDKPACQAVRFKASFTLEQLAFRISSGQELS